MQKKLQKHIEQMEKKGPSLGQPTTSKASPMEAVQEELLYNLYLYPLPSSPLPPPKQSKPTRPDPVSSPFAKQIFLLAGVTSFNVSTHFPSLDHLL